MAGKVNVGDKAPDFTLPAQDGRAVSLKDYQGTKNVVLYFYPKDFTMGCTTEARAFGESYGEIAKLGAEVLGVSSDSTDSHAKFATKCEVGFVLLSDSDGKVRKAYGASSALGLMPGRVTFVIDKQGVVRHVFSSQIQPRQHVQEAVEALEKLPA